MNQQWGRGGARPDPELRPWTVSTSASHAPASPQRGAQRWLPTCWGHGQNMRVRLCAQAPPRGRPRCRLVSPDRGGPVQAGAQGLGAPPSPRSWWRSHIWAPRAAAVGRSGSPCLQGLQPHLSDFWGRIAGPLKRGADREAAGCGSQSQDVGSRPSHRSRCAPWG